MSERRRLHDNWGGPEWLAYVRETHTKSVAAIIETGRRLRQAHAAFKRDPQKWGSVRWEKWAEDLGYSPSTISMMENIADEFGGENFTVGKVISRLPASWRTLYELAKVHRAAPEIFEAALADGRISPETTRQQAEDLLDDEEQQEQEPVDAEAEAEIWVADEIERPPLVSPATTINQPAEASERAEAGATKSIFDTTWDEAFHGAAPAKPEPSKRKARRVPRDEEDPENSLHDILWSRPADAVVVWWVGDWGPGLGRWFELEEALIELYGSEETLDGQRASWRKDTQQKQQPPRRRLKNRR